MVRKRQNKRASKFSLEKETDLTHFGKRINEMSKTEMRNAYVGSDDEHNDEGFSYDSLISKSKEERAAARRQKMEAEAALVDLDDSFQTVLNCLERRDIDADKLAASKIDDSDDLAVLARSFQMDNIKKAMAGDRTITLEERREQVASLVRKSNEERHVASLDAEDEDEERGEVLVESDESETELVGESSEPAEPSVSGLFGLIDSILSNPVKLKSSRSELVSLARHTPGEEIDSFFKARLFDAIQTPPTAGQVLFMKIVAMMFPVDHMRHSIAVPTMKLLESICFSNYGNLCHLHLLTDFLVCGNKYSASFFSLAGRLYKQDESLRSEVLALTSRVCEKFSLEALYGPISHFFPELLEMLGSSDAFVPLKLHHFKPVEVLALEPAFHEDGSQWNGQHREIREQKRLERQVKQEKKLTVKEMRREAAATEAFSAIERNKEREKAEKARKRFETQMQEAEQNWRLTKTDQGKDDGRRMKSNKKRRQGGKK
jgi:hypothetical protein